MSYPEGGGRPQTERGRTSAEAARTRLGEAGRGRGAAESGARPSADSSTPKDNLLIVFAGAPKVGDMAHAAEEFGVRATAVDILNGGSAHDVTVPEVFERLVLDVRRGLFTVLWLAPPCSSFSVLHLGRARGRLRTREAPEGGRELVGPDLEYVRRHNELAERSATLARAAYEAGATFVVENPVDRGERRSPFFSRKFRRHVPIWLLPTMRKLAEETSPLWVSVAQCAFLGEFQKLTTLMAAGPRAGRLRAVEWARCTHESHPRRARGWTRAGGSEASQAAAYPPVFSAAVIGVLFAGCAPRAESVQEACTGVAAYRLRDARSR